MPYIEFKKTSYDFRRDRRLSYKARGLLAYIASHESPWQVRIEDLINQSDEDGRIAVQSAMQELIKWQYARLEIVRNKEGRVQGKQYVVTDVPADKQVLRSSENASIGKSDKQVSRQSENMPVGEPENDVDTNDDRQAGFMTVMKHDGQETCPTKDLKKKKDLKTKTKKKDIALAGQNGTEDEEAGYTMGFCQFWEAYPVKKSKDNAWGAWKKKGCERHLKSILQSIQQHLAHDKQWRDGYVQYPATFLNGGGWKDEFVTTQIVPSTTQGMKLAY